MSGATQSPLVARICHGALQTPDLDASVRHATEVLGLRETERDGDAVYLTCGVKHHDLVLIAGASAGLHHSALEAAGPAALDEIAGRLADREEEAELIADGPATEPGLEGRAIRFRHRSGHVFEVHDGIAEAEPAEYETAGARPRKFGHITVTSPDRADLETFLEEVLGFIPSDRVGEEAVWMRCNNDHHGIAILGGADAGLRHFAWEVAEVAEVVAFADAGVARGHPLTWGIGRHGPGNNVAAYQADPAGAVHEYLWDLEQIEDPEWRGRDWAGETAWRNVWGPLNETVTVQGDFPRSVGSGLTRT